MSKNYNSLVTKLKQLNSTKLDSYFNEYHNRFFNDYDCTTCAYCCKQLGPLVTNHDINKISKFLRIKSAEFVENYLKVDEDGDYVFKQMPCVFLDENNYCKIYEVRPRACREYPHTDKKNIRGILNICVKNIEFCPAVEYIFKELEILRQHSKL